MKKQPNYELLRDAYAIIGGIPQAQIELDDVVTKLGESLSCGTIACGIGWLAMHPKFNKLGLTYDKHMGLMYKGIEDDFDCAASKVFRITTGEASKMFAPSPYMLRSVNHKHVLLNRIKRFLIRKGQPVNDPTFLPEWK